jgi:hypothetical protein
MILVDTGAWLALAKSATAGLVFWDLPVNTI